VALGILRACYDIWLHQDASIYLEFHGVNINMSYIKIWGGLLNTLKLVHNFCL
jgi:hypothetical protein